MRGAGQIIVAAAARLYAPVLAAIALALLLASTPDRNLGFFTGLLFALAPLVHALAFGAEAAQRAFPAWLARAVLALGLGTAVASSVLAAPALRGTIMEGAAFLAAAGAAQLIATVFIGRAPTLPQGEW